MVAALTFRHEHVYARRLGVARGAGVVAGVVDLRLPDDEPALSPRPRHRLDRDVPPGVVVVDHPVVPLPVHVLRRLWALRKRV